MAPVNGISRHRECRGTSRGQDVLEVSGRGILVLQAELDGLDGTVPQGNGHLLDRLRIIAHAPFHTIETSDTVNREEPGRVHVVSLADAIDGVEEPLVVEVVLALDQTAEFFQQLGRRSKRYC